MAVMDTTALLIAGCILYVFLFASLLWHRARAGSVILDLGGPNRALWITAAIIPFLCAVVGFVEWYNNSAKPIWPAVFWSESAIFVLLVPSPRLQIREKGIFRNAQLVPWSALKSYRWEIPTNTVFMDRQSALPWLRKLSLRVADESLIPKVDAILRTRMAAPVSAKSAWQLNRQAD
jgi:hypothetical protein